MVYVHACSGKWLTAWMLLWLIPTPLLLTNPSADIDTNVHWIWNYIVESTYKLRMYTHAATVNERRTKKTIVFIQKHACVEQIDNHTPEIFAFVESIYLSFRLTKNKRRCEREKKKTNGEWVEGKKTMKHPIWSDMLLFVRLPIW